MYNRNYGGFDYVRIHSELQKSVLNRKIVTLNPYSMIKTNKSINIYY